MAPRTTRTAAKPAEAPEVDLSTILAAAQTEAQADVQPEPEAPTGIEAAQTLDDQQAAQLSRYKPGSEQLEALLASGYGMDRQQAETIIRERAQNPALYPYEVFKKAQAFLEALNATPKVIAKNPGWNRSQG